MQIKIANGIREEQHLSEIVDLSNEDFSANYSLKGIAPFTLDVIFNTFEDEVEVSVYANVTVTLECAYSLELFEQVIEIDELLIFNFMNKDIEAESDDAFYEPGPYIELDHYLFALILSYIPLVAIKPGAKRPTSGEGYEVLSEEEYAAKKQTLGDDFEDIFSKLDIDEE